MDFFDFVKNNKLIILLISIFMNVFLIIISFIFIYNYMNYECVYDEKNIESSKEISDNINDEEEQFFVEIKGEVKKPNVYKINSSNIINDVVILAGGFTKNAYTKNINLSKKISNEMVIYVYSKNEYNKKSEREKITQDVCACPTYDIEDCKDKLVSEIVVDENKNNSNNIKEENNISNSQNNDVLDSSNKFININTASKEELMTISGIGESKANAIIEYRKNVGLFEKIEDIKNVSGIGDSVFEKIKNSITV